MYNGKCKTAKIVAIIVTSLMFSSTFLVFSNSSQTNVSAQTTTAAIPADLLQYEWTQPSADASHSFTSDGPGPNSFNIKWRAQLPEAVGQPIAFAGKIFVQTKAPVYGSGRTTYCLDAATGQLLWTANGVVGSMVKLDDDYILIGNNAYNIADGSLSWASPIYLDIDYGAFLHINGLTPSMGIGYDPDTKTFFSGIAEGVPSAWKFSDASQPPTLLWSRATQSDFGSYGTEKPMAYNQGIVICSTSYQYLLGINATTGKTLWATPTKVSSWIYALSIEDGVIGFGAPGGTFYGWNLITGELMWTYNPGSYYNMFASAVGSAYGMFYEHNQDTYIYAINATTGKLVWKTNGTGIAYSNILTIAGGKIYCQMGENQYVDFATGNPGYSEFYCLDAYTGELIWSAPFETGAPFNSQCNAYGNLYVTPMISSAHPGEYIYSYDRPDGGIYGTDGGLGEVWCISDEPQDWSMAFNDPEHSSFGNGPTNLALKWNVEVGGGIVSSPTLVDGIAYIGAYDGYIYAFDAETATQIWNYSIGKLGFTSTLAVVNGKLYTGPDDGNAYCLDAETGSKLWETSVGAAGTGSPTVTKGKVYVGGGDKLLYCLNAANGAIDWTYNATGAIAGTPAVSDGAVYITAAVAGGVGPNLIKINATTGALLFNVDFPGWSGRTSVSASPTVGAGMVFVRADNRYNYAINVTTGEIVWMVDARYNVGTPEQAGGVIQPCAMLYKYGRVYFNDYYGITCVNAFNGTELWHTFLSRENIAQGLSYSYGHIYTVNENGALYVLDPLTGEKLSYYQFIGGGAQLHSMPTPYNGSLYVASLDWNLYRFDEAIMQEVVATDFTISLSTTSITKGDVLYITGSISNVGRVPATLTLDKPDSTYDDVPVMTDDNGNFMVIYTPDISGVWTITVWWNGDDLHTASASETLTLAVTDPQVPEPTPTPLSLSDLYLLPATAGIIAAIVVIGLVIILMLRKR